jgi:hypothetical protein
MASAVLLGAQISEEAAAVAAASGSMEAMNAVYFGAEDSLNSIARDFGGTWNVQLGFSFDDRPQRSTRALLKAVFRTSPFTAFLRSAAERILKESPSVVGLSIASEYQLVHGFQLAEMLKALGSTAAIILGGNVISRLIEPLSIPEVFEFVDGLVAFGGEVPLLHLASTNGERSTFDTIPGLTWFDGASVQVNVAASALALKDAVAPSYKGLEHPYWGTRYHSVVAERGCYYGKCTFCAIPYGWGAGGYAGSRSAAHTAGDLQQIAQTTGVTRFKFVDEAMRPSFVRALASHISGDGFEWEAYTRLESAFEDSALFADASAAGLRKLYFGLEIAPSATRAALGKNDHGRVQEILKSCSDNGVKVHLFCMAGYPGTTEADAYQTVDFLLRNIDRVDTADMVPWGYARHTSVPGVRRLERPEEDLALEYNWSPEDASVISQDRVEALGEECESALWDAAPRLLHPIHRLVSPWST